MDWIPMEGKGEEGSKDDPYFPDLHKWMHTAAII